MEKIIEKYRNEYARISTMMLGEMRRAGIELTEIEFKATRNDNGSWHPDLQVVKRCSE